MDSRIKNSIRNSSIGVITYLISVIFSFVTRTVFIVSLGNIYLGLNGLFSDILQILSLAEMGVGTAVLFGIYKSVAYDDERKISAYMNFYKKIYIGIGILITIFGLFLVPFLDFFISNAPSVSDLSLIYVLYLLNTSLSYFFSYKRSLLIATQRNHVNVLNQFIFLCNQNILQIIVLVMTHNFLLYLIIQVVLTILSNLTISKFVDKHYPYLLRYKDEQLSEPEKHVLKTNIISMLASRISSVVVTSTDNIFISKFVSTAFLGLYSNYTLFTSMIKTIISKIFEGVTGSIGNYVAKECNSKKIVMFYNLLFVNFWIVSLFCILFFVLINDFISLWIGPEYIIDFTIIALMSINMFLRLIRNTMLTYIDTLGLFKAIKLKSLCEALINFFVSLILVKYFNLGVFGILIGTFISNLFANYFWEPYIVLHQGLDSSLKKYHIRLLTYLILTCILTTSLVYLNSSINLDNIYLSFLLKVLIDFAIINFGFMLFFYRTKEFIYFTGLFKIMFSKIFTRNTKEKVK